MTFAHLQFQATLLQSKRLFLRRHSYGPVSRGFTAGAEC